MASFLLSSASWTRPLTALLWLLLLTMAKSVQIGDEVCVEGFIMDLYCIELGTLLDNRNVITLEGPDQHSVHCLIDVSSCISSPFEILIDPEESGALYARGWRVDDNGKNLLVDLAKRTGICGDCDNVGTIRNGFRATVNGTVVNLGTGSTPALLAISAVADSSVGCGNNTVAPVTEITDSGRSTLSKKHLVHGSLMLVGWGFLLPFGALVARFFKYRPNGLWFQIHRACQLFGLLLSLIGWSIALKNFDTFSFKGTGYNQYPHAVLGMTVMCLGLLQPLNALLRPHKPEGDEKKSTLRIVWEVVHKGSGWIALVLAIATIALGTTILPSPDDEKAFQIAYGVGWGCLLLLVVWMCFDKKKYLKGQKEGFVGEEKAVDDEEGGMLEFKDDANDEDGEHELSARQPDDGLDKPY